MFCVSEKVTTNVDRVKDGQGQVWNMNDEALEEHGEPEVLESSSYQSGLTEVVGLSDSTEAFRQEVWTF